MGNYTNEEVINILSKIADIAEERAKDYLTKYSKLFNRNFSDLMPLIDLFNDIDNNYPISIKQLLDNNLKKF